MEFYTRTNEAWQVMFADCASAKHSIDLEQYIVWNDTLGQRFLALLTEKAAQGVNVRLVLDAVGSRTMRSSSSIKEFRRAGGRVVFYRPLWWMEMFLPWLWFPRNHCKILMIDGNIAHLGGICIAGFMEGWRDTEVRLEGALVQELHQDFLVLWSRLLKESKVLSAMSYKDKKLEVAVQQPTLGRYPIFRELLKQIEAAQHTISIVTPYFFPPRKLRKALYRAHERGVEVVLMLSHHTDVPLADKVSRALLGRWLLAGFKVLFYQASVLHAKYLIIDDDWATMGSTNFDHMSLVYNREANMIFHHKEHVALLKGHFTQDRSACVAATLEDWRKQSWWNKIIGFCGAQVHKFM